MRGGQVVAAALVVCLVVGAAAAWGALSLAGQGVRGAAWSRAEGEELFAARGALEWARWRLASDPGFLTLQAPRVQEEVPGVQELPAAAVEYVLATEARLARVFGPDLPVPPGLLAGVYAWVEDSFSPDGASDPAPVPLGGLEPAWRVAAAPAEPGGGEAQAPGLFRAGSEGLVLLEVPELTGGAVRVAVGRCEGLPVEVGVPEVAGPLVRLSPRPVAVDSVRPVPFTAVLYGPDGPRQVLPGEAAFELVWGPGELEPAPWGVLYRPAGEGRVTVGVAVTVGEVECRDEVSFEVISPQRLCRVLPRVGGRAWGEAWVRDWGGRASLESWDAGP